MAAPFATTPSPPKLPRHTPTAASKDNRWPCQLATTDHNTARPDTRKERQTAVHREHNHPGTIPHPPSSHTTLPARGAAGLGAECRSWAARRAGACTVGEQSIQDYHTQASQQRCSTKLSTTHHGGPPCTPPSPPKSLAYSNPSTTKAANGLASEPRQRRKQAYQGHRKRHKKPGWLLEHTPRTLPHPKPPPFHNDTTIPARGATSLRAAGQHGAQEPALRGEQCIREGAPKASEKKAGDAHRHHVPHASHQCTATRHDILPMHKERAP